jgi:pyruvate dehydrogenase E2 component (dihydrolipoamide acetyltransferase)
MRIAIVMPQLGLTMVEGTVTGWLKKPGDSVEKSEPLLNVSTDKVEMEVEAEVGGTLSEIIVPIGETVPVGAVLAYIDGTADDITVIRAARPPVAAPGAPSAPDEALISRQSAAERNSLLRDPAEGKRLVSPRARRLATELGIDLAAVRGRDLDGHITEKDIRDAAKSDELGTRRGNDHRQLIAERLTVSLRTIPAFSVAAEVNAEKLLGFRESVNGLPSKAAEAQLTITDLLLMAFATALKKSPELNATWGNNTVRKHASVEIGLAVATAKGVLAPVLRHLEAIDLPTLINQRTELVEKARLGRLSLADLEGGATTLSTLGMYRVDHFQGIISPGQSSILAVGQIRKRPWVEDALTVKPTLILNLTVDHRVTDGAAAAAFLGQIIELIENPQDLS